MLGFLIQNAYAQAASTAAVRGDITAGNTATASGSLQGLINFVITNIDNWVGGIVVVFASYVLAKFVANSAKESIIKSKGEEVQESALVLVERVTKILIIGVGITIAFAINGFNFTAVIGAVSLGIGFALKDIIGTFISSVVLLSQNRFRIGDFIQVRDLLGTIVSIDTRVTVLQALDGSEVVIPNQTMLNETIISFSTNPFRRVDIEVGVDYKTDLPMVTSLIQGVMENHPSVVAKPAPTVLVDEFGESAIKLSARFWVESSAKWLDIRSNMANRIKQALDKVGVNIPFPIRTLKLDENDRAFLKTMDSLKKGIVPEKAEVPTDETIRQAAMETANTPHVPKEILKNNSHADLMQAMDKAEQKTREAKKDVPRKITEGPKKEAVSTPPTHV
ncbi:MAG: mechanosensitive ion channel domain-containing protein [Candidatus Peregrinibacteria bacterium]